MLPALLLVGISGSGLPILNSTAQGPKPKNVILLIADGTGYTSFQAASMFEGRPGKEVFNGPGWITRAMSTYPLRPEKEATGKAQDPNLVYDPAKAWDRVNGYQWLKDTATDSGASASAYSTGKKSFRHSICWSGEGKPILNATELYKRAGKSVGVVTSVEWADATPAAMVAHNRNRDNHAEIAREMVEKSKVDLVMGACHPWFDGDGKRRAQMIGADWVGNEPYVTTPLDKWKGVRFIETKADFLAFRDGKLAMKGCKRLVGTAQVSGVLQLNRSATKDWNKDGKIDGGDQKASPPFGDPYLTTVPDLRDMARGALRFLSANKKGFFLMVEGGAVDHANHFNWPGRMIEEATQFFRAVEAVDAWVKAHGGYNENLVIVTTDHECGFVLGPKSDKVPFDPIVNHGKGQMPGLRHNSTGHTNALVPVFARGPGAKLLPSFATKQDPVRGWYLDNTDLHKLIKRGAS
jgi:alkaline phosphatase